MLVRPFIQNEPRILQNTNNEPPRLELSQDYVIKGVPDINLPIKYYAARYTSFRLQHRMRSLHSSNS